MDLELLTPATAPGAVPALAELLVDAVAGGASVGFLHPLVPGRAAAFWRAALTDAADGDGDGNGDGDAATWVARDDDGTPVGVVRLLPAAMPNGSHRAEVSKLLVHRSARGRGVATALLAALEAEALRRGRWLLLLDTQTGSGAEHLYVRLGWQRVGVIEDHALTPSGDLAPTTLMVRRLREP